MAGVIMPQKGPSGSQSFLDAVGRALQGYQAFTGARENVARTDQIQQQTEREKAGLLTAKEELTAASSGKFKEFGIADSPDQVPKGAIPYKVDYDPERTRFGIPNQPEFKAPYQKTDLVSKTGSPLAFDPRTATYIEDPNVQGARSLTKNTEITPYQQRQLAIEERKLSAAEAEKAAKAAPKSYEEKVKGLNASDRARFDNVKMASNAIQDMGEALKAGQKTFSILGDNDFTIAERDFAEALGRMQSGGAISKDEEKRFLAMAPKALDPPDTREKKLKRMQAEMDSRLSTLGFDRSEIPELANRVSPVTKKKSGGPSDTAIAAPASKPPEEMSDAERAAELKRLRGGK